MGSLFGGAGVAARTASVPLTVTNHGRHPVVCTAALAHWYSSILLRVERETTGEAFLQSDTADGTVFILNETRTKMPVEQVLCGQPGGAMVALPLLRRAGQAEPPIQLVCDDAGCRP